MRRALASIWRMRSRITPELIAHLFQGMGSAVVQAKAHPECLVLAVGECGQRLVDPVAHHSMGSRLVGCDGSAVLDEVAQEGVLMLAYRGFEGHGLDGKFWTSRIRSGVDSMAAASSSVVGSRCSSCRRLLWRRLSLLMISIMCTGTRMVPACSAMPRVMACRIHQVAQALNL